MNKIIIISYFYPPCNLTSSQRILSWAKNFSKEGLFPIVVTRNWDRPIHEAEDVLYSSGENDKHEVYNTHEVFYLKYANSLRDKLFIKYKGKLMRTITKFLTIKELILQNYFISSITYSNIFYKVDSLINADPTIKYILISGGPFTQFKFGYLLKKKYPHIKWIADYRDDWSTNEINRRDSFLRKMIFRFESVFEKKWLKNSSAIISVSPWYTQKISKFTGVKGYTVYNGYETMLEPASNNINSKDSIVFLYNGTLYPTQPIETFLETLNEVGNMFPMLSVVVQFPGLLFDPKEADRVKECVKSTNLNILILPRIPKDEVIRMQQMADILLMFAHAGKRGVTSSKIFEYMSIRKPVLLFPSDGDIIQDLIENTGIGFVTNTKHKLKEVLIDIFQRKVSGTQLFEFKNDTDIASYTRDGQAIKLAKIIKDL